MESVLGATPQGFESLILRSPDQHLRRQLRHEMTAARPVSVRLRCPATSTRNAIRRQGHGKHCRPAVSVGGCGPHPRRQVRGWIRENGAFTDRLAPTAEGATDHGGLHMTAGTERSLGMAIAVLGVVVLVVAVVVLDGTEAWLLASSAVLLLVCGAGLVMNARSRLRREHRA